MHILIQSSGIHGLNGKYIASVEVVVQENLCLKKKHSADFIDRLSSAASLRFIN
jgi:hypothetical protein